MLNRPSAVIAVLAVVLAINGFLFFEYYLPRTTTSTPPSPVRTEREPSSPKTTAEPTQPTTTLEETTTSTATSTATATASP